MRAIDATAAVPADETFIDAYGQRRHVHSDRDGDLLLFESGRGQRRADKGWSSLSDPPEPEVFQLFFTRQFSFEDDHGEYLGMNGLTLTIESDCGLERKALCWGHAGDVDAWLDKVERDPAFVDAFAANRSGSTSARATTEPLRRAAHVR